jgi:hypothetical protein
MTLSPLHGQALDRAHTPLARIEGQYFKGCNCASPDFGQRPTAAKAARMSGMHAGHARCERFKDMQSSLCIDV